MKRITGKVAETGGIFGLDTAIVLFLLAVEYGRAVQMFSIDGSLMAVTMVMVALLPYFLPSRYAQPRFANWVFLRGGVALAGILLGFALRQSMGVILPESLKFLPLTLLIAASMVSCYVRFYSLMRLRLAK